ncbi:MAG: DUF2512 family protein [bacterium]|nr:DUF2512 family protein [bacterium]
MNRLKHLPAVLIKLAVLLAISHVVLVPWAGATRGQATGVALFMTVILYLLGDLVILPAVGASQAAVVDGGLALVLAWLAPAYAGTPPVGAGTALVLGTMVGIAEYLFHGFFLQVGLRGGAGGG